MITLKHKVNVEHFFKDVHMGNCFRLFAGPEQIAILPDETAVELMVDMLAQCMPNAANSQQFTYCPAYLPGANFR